MLFLLHLLQRRETKLPLALDRLGIQEQVPPTSLLFLFCSYSVTSQGDKPDLYARLGFAFSFASSQIQKVMQFLLFCPWILDIYFFQTLKIQVTHPNPNNREGQPPIAQWFSVKTLEPDCLGFSPDFTTYILVLCI